MLLQQHSFFIALPLQAHWGVVPKSLPLPHVHGAAAKASAPCTRSSRAHWYWFTRLYFSPNPRSPLNINTKISAEILKIPKSHKLFCRNIPNSHILLLPIYPNPHFLFSLNPWKLKLRLYCLQTLNFPLSSGWYSTISPLPFYRYKLIILHLLIFNY